MMPIVARVNAIVGSIVIREHSASRHHKFLDEAVQRGLRRIGSHASDHMPALALYSADNGSLLLIAAHRATSVSLAPSAVIHLIHFHRCRPLQFVGLAEQ